MNTPEFLMWAIEFACSVRGFQNGSDPERTERQLRTARAVSGAEREGRVFEGVAVRGEEGFRVEEAMGVYGGSAAVDAACESCPANVLAHENRRILAGCFGTVVCPWSSESFHAAVNGAVERQCGARDLVPRTTPAWYGLWIGSPLEGKRVEATARILEAVEADEPDAATGLGELVLALCVAKKRGLRVQVAVYPASSDDAGVFALAPHCPKCKMSWRLKLDRGVCAACGYDGFPVPTKKRRARGRRPYFPLTKLLGEPGAREFLSRYAADRAR